MDVRGVDPRDQTAEVSEPAYRVYFWTGDPERGLASNEYERTGADVHEVIAWADGNADGRAYSLWARIPDFSARAMRVGLVRLAGWDASAVDSTDRPRHAVSVPESAVTGVV